MEKMQWDMLEMILNSESGAGRLSEAVTKFVIYQVSCHVQQEFTHIYPKQWFVVMFIRILTIINL